MDSKRTTAIIDGPARRSTTELLRDTIAQSHAVIRGEIRVALAEAGEELREAGRDALFAMLGAAFGLLSITLLIIAGIAVLAQYLPLWGAVLAGAALSTLLTVATFTYSMREEKDGS